MQSGGVLLSGVSSRSSRRIRLGALGTLPAAAALMTFVLALYTLLVFFGNVTDFGTNLEFVRHVLAMDTTFHDHALAYRAITNPALQVAVYIGVIGWEGLTTVVLVGAVAQWLVAFRGKGGFDRVRRSATVGLLMIIVLFTGGFIVIGGEWFAMWQSTQWNGLQPALQNTILAAFALLLVHLPARQWEAGDAPGPRARGREPASPRPT
jgi:predicted small integral membrane protein